MANMMVISDLTATRMEVIANRTQNLLIAGAKAMMIENLKSKLRSGVAHFIFQKKNGELREMFATTCPSLVKRHINGRGAVKFMLRLPYLIVSWVSGVRFVGSLLLRSFSYEPQRK